MEKEKKNKGCKCSENCGCHLKDIIVGYKHGLGFWLSGLTVWLLVSLVIALLYTLVRS